MGDHGFSAKPSEDVLLGPSRDMVARMETRKLAAAASLLGLLVAGMSCKREPSQRFDCTCHFLTDFDDASRQSVEVCAADPRRAEAAARGCAQSAAPAPVQSCSCRAADRPGCPPDDCRIHESE